MDKILLNQLTFYGYHGVFPEENKLGQRFIVDLELTVNLRRAGQTDDLSYTVNYGEVYQLVKQIVEGKTYKLVEAIAETIASEMFQQFSIIEACMVRVVKPNPPIEGHYESVAIEIKRERP